MKKKDVLATIQTLEGEINALIRQYERLTEEMHKLSYACEKAENEAIKAKKEQERRTSMISHLCSYDGTRQEAIH